MMFSNSKHTVFLHSRIIKTITLFLLIGMTACGSSDDDDDDNNDVTPPPDDDQPSELGVTWTLKDELDPARATFATVVYDSKMWIIGGVQTSGATLIPFNDVWSSSDGANWVLENEAVSFSARSGHAVVQYNNRLYLIGGSIADNSNLADVWVSDNGTDWDLIQTQASFGIRSRHKALVFNNRIWVIGGQATTNVAAQDAWSSSDGINWEKEIDLPTSFLTSYDYVVFNNQLYAVGKPEDDSSLIQFWQLSETVWENLTTQVEIRAIGTFNATRFVIINDNLWILTGGRNVFKSDDGLTWSEVTTAAEYQARFSMNALTFDNKLWVLGDLVGSSISGTPRTDVWCSE